MNVTLLLYNQREFVLLTYVSEVSFALVATYYT